MMMMTKKKGKTLGVVIVAVVLYVMMAIVMIAPESVRAEPCPRCVSGCNCDACPSCHSDCNCCMGGKCALGKANCPKCLGESCRCSDDFLGTVRGGGGIASPPPASPPGSEDSGNCPMCKRGCKCARCEACEADCNCCAGGASACFEGNELCPKCVGGNCKCSSSSPSDEL